MQKPEEEIKRLLLSDELDLLEKLRSRLDRLEVNVGNDPALSASVGRVIVGALREAGVRDHDRLARALAPLVVAAMREEIRNSRDMMVDALYPITGRLVAAAVRNAFQDLLAKINRTLDDSFSFERWQVRLKAKLTGQSEAELLLQRNPPFEIEELLVIQRNTGLLIAHSGRSETAEGGIDSDLISGMLTAIMAFARDAMGAGDTEELQTVGFADSELFLRSSAAVILAVKASGPPPPRFQARLELVFCDLIDRWGERIVQAEGNLPEQQQSELIEDLRAGLEALQQVARERAEPPSRKGLFVLATAAAVLLAWIGVSMFDTYRIARIQETASRVIADEPGVAGYPVTLRYDEVSEGLVVSGLLPDAATRNRLVASLGLALPEVPSEIRMPLLPRGELEELVQSQEGLQAALAQFGTRLSSLESATDRVDTSVRGVSGKLGTQVLELRQLQKHFASLEGLADGLEKSIEGLNRQTMLDLTSFEARLKTLEDAEPTPIDRLERWTREQVIFFAEGTDLRFPGEAEAKLQSLARLIDTLPQEIRLRVVGYSDALGTFEENQVLSLERAQAVASQLVDLKTDPRKLLAVGRGPERALSTTSGPEGGNRRVEFELLLHRLPEDQNAQ